MGLFRKKSDVIDLRDHVLARQRQARSAPFEFGFPTRCPACHGRGYIDHIDLSHRIQYEHCTDCSLKWQSTEDEVYALNG
jgi:DnaJ-class molecular chaperone